MVRFRRDTVLATTLLFLGTTALVACDGGKDDIARDASERAAPAESAPFPDAPSPVVRKAVRQAALEVEEGQATFYADRFEGRRTASGRTFRQQELVAAHRAFPFGTRLRVINTRNDNEVEVTVVDRGPFGHGGALRPTIDLSRAAAERLDFIASGRTAVRVEVIEWG